MSIGIETILKDHGLNHGGSQYAGFVETKVLENVNGTDVPLPTSYYNPTRDVALVFVNGTYLPPADYAVVNQETLRFNEALTGQTVSLIIMKTAHTQKPLIDGEWVEDGSIFINKLSSELQAKLADPEEKLEAKQFLEDAVAEIDDLHRSFAAIELFWSAQNRVQGGTVFGDDFKSEPLGVTFLDADTTLVSAANMGQRIVVVADATLLRVGNEVTLYDNNSFERRRITDITGDSVTLDTMLTQNFKQGTVVTRSMGVRDTGSGAYDFPVWTDPVDGYAYEVQTYDVRYYLPENDRFVAWVESLDADVDVEVSYPTQFTTRSEYTKSGEPDILMNLVTDTSIQFEAKNNFDRTVIKYNGTVVADYGGGDGVYTHHFATSKLQVGANEVMIESTATDRLATAVLNVELIPEETYVSTTMAVNGNETQATLYREGVGACVVRLTFSRSNPAVRPTFKRLLGGIDRE